MQLAAYAGRTIRRHWAWTPARTAARVTADVAADGEEALASWRSGHYALLVTDLHMPEMDGFELAKAIRSAEARWAR